MKITLEATKPPVWRRIQVQSDVNLRRMHGIFQVVMGWTNSHLYAFEASGQRYSEPDPEFGFDEDLPTGKTKLNQIAPDVGAKFQYAYDFGDDWRHAVVVEKVTAPEDVVHYPFCVDGRRACPPEDCGGTPGYSRFLRILARPTHREHTEMLEWVGGHFDPDAFDVDATNAALGSGRISAPSAIR